MDFESAVDAADQQRKHEKENPERKYVTKDQFRRLEVCAQFISVQDRRDEMIFILDAIRSSQSIGRRSQ